MGHAAPRVANTGESVNWVLPRGGAFGRVRRNRGPVVRARRARGDAPSVTPRSSLSYGKLNSSSPGRGTRLANAQRPKAATSATAVSTNIPQAKLVRAASPRVIGKVPTTRLDQR